MTTVQTEERPIDVEVQDQAPCRKSLRITLPAEMVKEQYDRLLKQYAASVRVPGFRPGKAPRQLVEGRHRKEIQEELRDRLVPFGYHKALEKTGLDVVQVIDVDEVTVQSGEPVIYQVVVDVAPDFELPDYKSYSITSEPTEVSDAQVQTSLDELLEYYGTFKEVSGRAIEAKDLVQLDYQATLDGTPLAEIDPEAKSLSHREDHWVRAGEEGFIPELCQGLIGMSTGDQKDIQVTLDKDFIAKALAGKTVTFAVSVKAIREKVPPVLDEAMFDKLQVESEEDLRSKLREDLERTAKGQELNRKKDKVVQLLLEQTQMELPNSEVAHETNSVIQDIVRQNKSQGVQDEEIRENKDKIYQAAEKNAQNTVKLRYILHRIAEAESVEVQEEEFRMHLLTLAYSYRMEPKELEAQLKKNNAIDNVREELRNRKTLDWIVEQSGSTAA